MSSSEIAACVLVAEIEPDGVNGIVVAVWSPVLVPLWVPLPMNWAITEVLSSANQNIHRLVLLTPLMEEAVATPSAGVTSVGEVANTGFPVPVGVEFFTSLPVVPSKRTGTASVAEAGQVTREERFWSQVFVPLVFPITIFSASVT